MELPSTNNVGINNTSPNVSAVLDIVSTTQGFLPPRTNLTSNISAPAQGLQTYLTGSTNEGLYYYNSGSYQGWTRVLNNTGSQSISGSLELTSALTASNAIISGNVTVLGTASINTLIVNQTQLSTGSNQLGDAADDFQTLYGTVRIPTGSLTVTGSIVSTAGFTGSLFGTASYVPTLNEVTTAGNTTTNNITVSQLFTNTTGSYDNTSIAGYHIGLTNTFGYTGGTTLTSDGALRTLSGNRKYIFYTDSNTQVGFMGSSKITSFNSALRFGTNFGTDDWMTLFTTGNVTIGTSTDILVFLLH
jgi:hypothetical protein